MLQTEKSDGALRGSELSHYRKSSLTNSPLTSWIDKSPAMRLHRARRRYISPQNIARQVSFC